MSSLYEQYKSKHSSYRPPKSLSDIVVELNNKCAYNISCGECLPFNVIIQNIPDKVDYRMLKPYLSIYGIIADRVPESYSNSVSFIVTGFKEIENESKDEPVPPSNRTWKSLFSWWRS